MEQSRKESVIVSGGFYTVVTVEIDIFKSCIIDERHFGTEEEAKAYQMQTIDNGGENIHCFIKLVA